LKCLNGSGKEEQLVFTCYEELVSVCKIVSVVYSINSIILG